MVRQTPCLPYLGVHTVSTKASGLGRRSRCLGGLLHETGERQLRHVSNIGVGETTITAQRQHGGDALQEHVALLDRQHARHVHDDLRLGVRQANHVPDGGAASLACPLSANSGH